MLAFCDKFYLLFPICDKWKGFRKSFEGSYKFPIHLKLHLVKSSLDQPTTLFRLDNSFAMSKILLIF